ncbi:MAG: four helix bundle protein [Pirellulales bacterium]|nr:four helix bundle protein [Pirellulales bacterium]
MQKSTQNHDLQVRTKHLALRIMTLYTALPKTTIADVLGKQVLRSGTSVGAQFREACRARSRAEFVSKLNSSLQELDETGYWLELLVEGKIVKETKLSLLIQEVEELTAIFVKSIKTAKYTS